MPKVDSGIINLHFKQVDKRIAHRLDDFTAIVKASFAHRRKTLVNSVSSTIGIAKPEICRILGKWGLMKISGHRI